MKLFMVVLSFGVPYHQGRAENVPFTRLVPRLMQTKAACLEKTQSVVPAAAKSAGSARLFCEAAIAHAIAIGHDISQRLGVRCDRRLHRPID
jgi:hypothetical protein